MSLSHQGESTGREKEASRPEGLELVLGPALIERTARAIEAEVRRLDREALARKAYLSQLKEMFAYTDDPSAVSSDGSSVFATSEPSSTRGPVVGGGSVLAGALAPTAERSEAPVLSGVEDGTGVTPDPRSSDLSAVRASVPGFLRSESRPAGGDL